MHYDAAVLERVAQRFRSQMWKSVPTDAVIESGVEVHTFGPILATSFGELPEATSLNQIQGAAEPGAIEGGHLAEAVEWMRSREVDYRVPVAEDRPGAAEAEAWLGERGYEPGEGWLKLVRDTSPCDLYEDPAIMVYELGEEEGDGEGLSDIATEALELPLTAGTLFFSLPDEPNWRCYTASLDFEEGVVSAAFMLIDGEIAQIGLGSTLEHARRRGCNLELIRRRLVDAAAAGCHTVFVELGERDSGGIAAAHRNLRRAGFEIAYRSHNWRRPALHPAEVFDY